jgi:hypothetical protein
VTLERGQQAWLWQLIEKVLFQKIFLISTK